MLEVILDALKDTAIALPFLFLAYLLMNYISSKDITNKILKYQSFGPVAGSLLGCIPQCGFSGTAAYLYNYDIITTGTLISIFASTSDEAFMVLIINPYLWKTLLLLIVLKIIIGIISGYVYDLRSKKEYEWLELEGATCDCAGNIYEASLNHMITTGIYILVINLVFGLLIYFIGQNNVSSFVNTYPTLQLLITPVIGFIPNCAGSIILATLYSDGAITFGSLLAGLITSAGIGTMELFSNKDKRKDIIKIFGYLYLVSVISGFIVNLIIK